MISLTDSSYADLMIAKFDVEKTLAFWTPERIKSAKPLTPKDIGFRNKTSRVKNSKVKRDDYPSLKEPFDNPDNQRNYPVGLLSITDPDTGALTTCTASVFNTDNGNIGITAGHCIFNNNGRQYENLMFSPGFDIGAPGPLGSLAVDIAAAPAEYNDDPVAYDYGMFRVNFDNGGNRLQDLTGANGWLLNPTQDNLITTVFGYPQSGDMPNCPNDGLHLCVIVGNVVVSDDESVMPNVDLGAGSSGAPWIINYNADRNLGYMYGNEAFYNVEDNQSESPRYDPETFNDLVEYVSDN
ncbi:11086_t:CDS:1 [Acaulospora colombiana]|uniref:11086_t:CDS:1 n=1 Tax=Acaulospora colombiana TaxID=27376 RepID=A0ACA9LDA8_9GLOM|nr:11086_t:CDS:1 [Acaulospora colombiana]